MIQGFPYPWRKAWVAVESDCVGQECENDFCTLKEAELIPDSAVPKPLESRCKSEKWAAHEPWAQQSDKWGGATAYPTRYRMPDGGSRRKRDTSNAG